MAFVEYHKPCHLCDSSDAVSINEDGSGYCFSCNERIHDYYGNRDYEDNVQDFKTYKNNTMNSNEGVFQTIKDRNKNPLNAKVGNGSKVKVQYKEWESERNGTTYRGLDLKAVQVLNLVTYEQDGDEFDIEDDEEELEEL